MYCDLLAVDLKNGQDEGAAEPYNDQKYLDMMPDVGFFSKLK